MDPYKTSRLNQAIKKTLSELLTVEVKDPRVGFVTINGVKLNRDHSVARVFYSVMGDDGDKQRSLTGLKKARGFLQGRLSKTLQLRQVPELRFFYDETIDRSLGLENILKDLEEQGEFEDEITRKNRLTLDNFQPPPDLITALCSGERFWVAPHWNPDPDAMGSALALAGALQKMGKSALVLSYPDPPVSLIDLPGFDEVVLPEEALTLLDDSPPDTLVLVDCHRVERLGPMAESVQAITNVWCIDHHLISGRQTPAPGWNDARSCSAATLTYQVIATLATGSQGQCEPFDIDLDMATGLYAGLFNDTGGFRFPNTMPTSFELAQKLAKMGVDTAEVARLTLHRFRPEAIALLQRVLPSLTYEAGGKIVVMHVDRDLITWSGAVVADTEGFVNIATAIDGVEFVILMKEIEDGVWRISLRAPGGGDVQTVASSHGGGGHKLASGCTIKGSAEEVAATLVNDLTAQLS